MNSHPTEDQLQQYSADVIRTFKMPGVVAFHVPNGGRRPMVTAKRLKVHGALPGVSDWVFIMPGGGARFLELKDHRGRQSDDQTKFQAAVEALGAPYAVARTPEEIDGVLSAWDVINKPLSQTVTRRGADGEPPNHQRDDSGAVSQFTEGRSVGP